MEVPVMPDKEQKETQSEPATREAVSKNKNAAESADRGSRESTHAVRKDPGAARKLARKKRLKAAHRRRLKASHAKG